MRQNDAQYEYRADVGERVCRFIETTLCHFEGRFAGKPFLLQPWQRKIVLEVFGTVHIGDGTRRFRTAYVELPRKSGKSALCAAIAIYLLCADGEAGAQVYSAALNTSQANITFDAAKKMIAASPQLRNRLDLKRYHIGFPRTQSVYKALSGENVGSHGKNTHGLILDEMHEWTTASSRDLYEALVTSMGARTQPLTVIITTAGHGGNETLCRQLHEKAGRVLAGQSDDDTFYAAIFAADPRDDWQDPATWAKANPSLGQTVTLAYLRAEAVKAAESSSYVNTFLRLYLNIWTAQATRWIPMDRYDACTRPIDPAELDGLPCFVGIDASAHYDFTAVVAIYVSPKRWYVVPRLYLPTETARRRQRDHAIPVPDWIEQGHVIGVEGSTMSDDQVEADIIEVAGRSRIVEVGYDPAYATGLVRHLEKAGLKTVPVYQRFIEMSAASKEIEKRLSVGTIVFPPNPAMRAMASAVEVEANRHGSIRPVKPRHSGKYAGTRVYSIDGIVAAIVAASRAVLHDASEVAAHAGPSIIYID